MTASPSLVQQLGQALREVGVAYCQWKGHARQQRWASGEGDIDLLVDPAFAPGVSHREPGGLTAREVLTLIQEIEGPIVGADVVEFNPSEDPIGLTAPLCAKLVKELASRMLETT